MAKNSLQSEVILPAEEGLPQPKPVSGLRIAGEPPTDTSELNPAGNRPPASSVDNNPAPKNEDQKKRHFANRVRALFGAPLVEPADKKSGSSEETETQSDEPEARTVSIDEDKSPPPAGEHKVDRSLSSAVDVLRDGLVLSMQTFDSGDSESAFALFVASVHRARSIVSANDGPEIASTVTTSSLIAEAVQAAFAETAAHASVEDNAGLFIGDTSEERDALILDQERSNALMETLRSLKAKV